MDGGMGGLGRGLCMRVLGKVRVENFEWRK
jgi:hypothetical protein